MSQLNPQQLAAVHHRGSPLLVLAGAGSGKTRVITRKIAWLISECGIAARHIAAVTFTNKAAREMKARLQPLLRPHESRGLRVSTFHTLGLDIIRHELAALDYRRGFSIYDASDSATLLRDLLRRDAGDERLAQEMQQRISHWKNSLLTPEQALASADDAASRATATLYAAYHRHLKACNAVDFDDLIMLPVLLFQHDAAALQRWQQRIRYLLVDEYQDTNTAQYRLVQLLVAERQAFTVVGDDDQSIYAWRGAQPENLALLQRDFPRLQVIKLEQNYRSSGRILRAANQLISHNPHLFEKRLWSALGEGEPLRIIRCVDEEDEAQRVVAEITQLALLQQVRHGEMAILYRGNHQARLFEQRLREQRIPYQISGGQSFFDHREIRDLIAYLRLLLNPDDDTALLRVINVPRREIGTTTLERLSGYARERGISLFSASFELGLRQRLNERAYNRLHRFSDWLVSFGQQVRADEPVAALRQLLQALDYSGWLRDSSDSRAAAERRLGRVEELVSWFGRLQTQPEGPRDLESMVSRMQLLDLLDRHSEEEEQDAVRLMTLHAAKGLEFPHLFLVGMEEDLLPHHSSIESDTIAEERRLAYVGITRAQRTLTMTLAQRRRRGGERVRCQPSRFLEELPAADVKWQGVGVERSEAERRAHGLANLAAIRAMLKG